jgi:hypothetical protein
VRDALDLSVDRGRGVPPRLLEDAPERSGLLDADSRHRAALEWPSWWVDAVGWRVGKENSHFYRAAPFFRGVLVSRWFWTCEVPSPRSLTTP